MAQPASRAGWEGLREGRVFFFVNKKEAKKTFGILDRAGLAGTGLKGPVTVWAGDFA
jgi:hypothetical protein